MGDRSIFIAEGNKELLEYDPRNNVTKLTRVAASGGLANIVLRANWHATWNKPAWIIDANGNQTDFAYFESGNGKSLLSTATRPSANGTSPRPEYSFTYNADGQMLTATDPTGLETANGYHSTNGNLLSTTADPAGFALTTSFGYDAQGLRTSATDPRGNVTETLFDANGRSKEVRSHNGGIGAALIAAQRTTYNLLGQTKKQEAGIAFSGTAVTGWQMQEQRSYTPTGQVATVTNAEGHVIGTTYDPLDRVDVVTDAVGRKTKTVYDAAGQRLTEYRAWRSGFGVSDPDTYSCASIPNSLQQCYATYSYTPNGQPETVADANGNLTTYSYDGHGRLSRTYFPSKITAGVSSSTDYEEFRYGPAGNITGKRTRKGDWILSAFDDLGQYVRKVPQSGGNYSAIAATCGASGSEVCTAYDLAGRADKVRFGNSSHVVDYGYDTAGRLSTVNDDGRTLSYLYDAASNRTRLNYPGTDNFYITYSYDALNRLDTIREKGSLVLANYDYDPLSRRSKLTYGNGRIIDYDYALDSAITEINHRDLLAGSTDALWSFDYTDANQLETRTTPTAFLWTADANETIDYTVNGLNAYTSVDGQTLSYDGNGSLTGDGVWSYGYDVENRLISATDAGGPQASFGYDPLGRRDSYTVDGTTTRYLSDGIEEIADYSSSGTLLRRYVHGLGIDEHLAMYTGTSLTSKQYYHTDHQGSSIAMSSNSGTLLDQYTYSAFGEVGAEGVAGNPFRYTGRRLDAETGLYYYRARYYSPALGRFLQTDPIGYEDDLNLFAYVYNEPVNHIDPSGQACTVLNGWSDYCRRAHVYAVLDWKFANQTRFFAAASATVELLANLSTPMATGLFTSGETRAFLSGVSSDLEKLNRRTANSLEIGELTGPNLDRRIVNMEQTAVQKALNSLSPDQYERTVSEINDLLNPSGPAETAANQLPTDRAYNAVVDKVRENLGRNIDFGNQNDREALGNALIDHVRKSGGCDIVGSRIKSC